MVGHPKLMTGSKRGQINMLPSLEQNVPLRLKVISEVVSAIILAAIFLRASSIYGQSTLSFGASLKAVFVQLGEGMQKLFTHKLALPITIFTGVVVVDALLLIVYVTHSERAIAIKAGADPITTNAGKFRGTEHYRCVELRWQKYYKNCTLEKHRDDGMVDMSGLDATQSGWAPVYEQQPMLAHEAISFAMTLLSLPYAAAAMAVNALCVVLSPLFILLGTAYEKCTGKHLLSEDEKLSITDIPKEIVYGIGRIIKAPFYGVALFFAALYSFIDPINGRKLMTHLELSWNYNDNEQASTPKHRGIWLGAPLAGFSLWRALLRGVWGFMGPACRHPIGWVHFTRGEIDDVRSGSHRAAYAIAMEGEEEGSAITFENLERRKKEVQPEDKYVKYQYEIDGEQLQLAPRGCTTIDDPDTFVPGALLFTSG